MLIKILSKYRLLEFILKKIFFFFSSKTINITEFPEGISNPFLTKNKSDGWYIRFYDEYVKDCSYINDFFKLTDKHLFKLEILHGKELNTKTVDINLGDDSVIPITSISNVDQKIKLIKNNKEISLDLIGQRFTYLKFNKNENSKILSSKNLILGNPIPLKQKNKLKYKLILILFIDGLPNFNNLGSNSFKSLMPNTHEFFSKGIMFNNHYANSEWSLPSFANIFTGGYTHNHGLFYHPKIIGQNYPILSELFQAKGYLTFNAGGAWRINPGYGYAKGFDRVIYKRHMDCKEIISQFFDHHYAFKNRDQFILLNFCDLHHFLKLNPSISSQIKLEPENFEKKLTQVKSVYEDFEKNKIEILKNEMALLDFNISRIYDYLERTFKDNEILVNIVTDHGHSYLGHSKNLLSQEALSIPWLLRGGGVSQSEYNKLTENVDIFKSLLNLCELDEKEVLNDGILPTILGGEVDRKYTFAESIYPNKSYQSRILDHKFTFDFNSSNKLDSNGKLADKNNTYTLKDKTTSKIINDVKISENYKSISESKINLLNKN